MTCLFVPYEMLIQDRNDRRWVALEPSSRVESRYSCVVVRRTSSDCLLL